MPTSYTSLLGMALPVTGDLSGTWGDTVNDYITKYVDASVAGTQTISGSQTAVTLSVTNGTTLSQAGSGATGSAQFAVINCTGNPASLLTVTAPASSRNYIVLNATSTSQSVKIVGTGPTTGVTVVAGESAIVAWNGSDFVKVSSSVDSVTLAGNNAFTGANTFYNSTGQTFGTATAAHDGIIVAGRAGGSSTYRITFTPATLSSNTTLTFPNVTDTVATIGSAQTFTAAQIFRAANSVRAEAASTQDAIVLAGRAGGSSSYAVTLTPATLSASRTLTLPDATTTVTGTDATQTLTNKRITQRVNSITDAATITPTGDSSDQYNVTALAQPATIAAPSGTPTSGQKLILRIKDNGTGRALTWTTTSGAYRAVGVTLPTTTTANKTSYIGCIYNSDATFWDVVAVTTEA